MTTRDAESGEKSTGRVDVLLVCSPGGHLFQLLGLRSAWDGYSRAWVTLDRSDSRSMLASERVHYAHGPTTRNVKNFFRNLLLARHLLAVLAPRVVVTTGAGLAVPFAWLARLRGARIVYVESFTRIEAPSLSCRLIAPVASRVYVQWPELADSVRGARYAGTVFS